MWWNTRWNTTGRRLNARALSIAIYLYVSNCLTQFLDIIEAIYII